MHVIAQSRYLLARHRWIYWAAVAAVAVSAGVGVRQRLTALDDERRAWGDTRTVLVATSDLEPGDEPVVEARRRPVAVTPPSALAEVADDVRLRQRVAAGEVLVAADVAAGPGPAALAAPGTVVVGVIDRLSPAPPVGTAVQIGSEGVVLADDARVVGGDGDVVFVAVPEQHGAAVAHAAQVGAASLLFVP